jgi:hypothetical protein
MVAATAPGTPPKIYPMNVAVERTGPGVNCPIATAASALLTRFGARRDGSFRSDVLRCEA